ncbi:MAG: PDZ domain-containing protein [Chloroflexota bacterium]|nr:PDZ domain-containing protein [Chloroflexota bacterium]
MRWLRAGFLPVSVLILLTAVLIVPLPFYLERPGTAVSLGACVDVDSDGRGVDGDFLLTTINVSPATAFDAVRGIVDDETSLVPRRQLLPPGVESEEFFSRQRELFAASADVAAGVGLEAAGYEVTVSGEGVQVVRILPGTPAAELLRPGDVIRSIDGNAVAVEADLREVIEDTEVGTPLRLQVQRDGEVLDVDVAPRLVQGMSVIGILPQTLHPRVDLPVDVEVATGPFGGPSAGLMIALTVYDKVRSDVDLAAGRIVAGTGSISQDGRVGPIGGVGLKVLAAEARGADVFLAPAADYPAAIGAVPAGSDLQIVSVETFDEARDAQLETIGEISRTGGAQGEACPYRKEGQAGGDRTAVRAP